MNRRDRRAAKAKERGGTAPPPALQAMLGAGIEHHRAGRLDQAAQAYREVLAIQPSNADALNLLGVIAHQSGDDRLAVEQIGRALELNGGVALYHNNMAAALRALDRTAEAVEHYRKAVELEPAYTEAHNNLGNAQMDLGDAAAAAGSYERAVEQAPDYADAHTGLGGAYMALDQPDRAAPHFRRAADLDPRSALAHQNLANLLEREGDHGGAVEHLRRATELDPSDAQAWYQLGGALRGDYALEEAETCLRKAVSLSPDLVGARYTFGLALKELDRPGEAVDQLHLALEIDPDDVECRNSLGNLLKELGEVDRAAEQYDLGLQRDPDHEALRTNRGLMRLTLGDFERGWDDYMARGSVTEKRAGLTRDRLTADLSGRRLFLLRDQGLGDEIFFLRFVRELKTRGAWIGYRADPKIAPMIARLPFIDRVLGPEEEPGDCDTLLSPGDLPHLLGLDGADHIPPSITLPPLPPRVDEMRDALAAAGPPPYLGATWRAGIQLRNKLSKITPLEAMAAALEPCQSTVIALQRAPREGEVEAFTEALGRPAGDLTALNADLEAMLALMALLDDYVCVSNTNTHLREAVGKTSRVLVPFFPDYRWMLSGGESPWFPGTRTYRQTPDRSWDDAFARLAADLRTAFAG